jgi:hypothetical protein
MDSYNSVQFGIRQSAPEVDSKGTWSSDGEFGFGRLPPSLHNEVVERPVAGRLL